MRDTPSQQARIMHVNDTTQLTIAMSARGAWRPIARLSSNSGKFGRNLS